MTKAQVIKSVVFCAIAGLLALFFIFSLSNPGTDTFLNYSLFYQEKEESLDVVMIGPSTVFSGHIPAVAWNDHGYTSYNFAGSLQPLPASTIAVEEAMRTQKPKLIVVDVNSIGYTEPYTSSNRKRELIDSMPLTDAKKALVGKYGTDIELSYYFTFMKYHSTIYNLFTKIELGNIYKHYVKNNETSILKGWMNCAYTRPVTILDVDDEEEMTAPIADYAYECLIELLETCKKYSDTTDTEFLFIRMPRFLNTGSIENLKRVNSGIPIIESYGFEYIDFSDHIDDIGVSPVEDYYDFDHLNVSGALKFTNYFGNYITTKYSFIGTHSQSVTDNFNACYAQTRALLDEVLAGRVEHGEKGRVYEKHAYNMFKRQ